MIMNNEGHYMGSIKLDGRQESAFLPCVRTDQRFHRRWWTALPGLPASKNSRPYRRLQRQFADHTMNTCKRVNGHFLRGPRGFYVEGREDHLVPAFFENFALFPNFYWLECVLSRLSVAWTGTITNAAWSYSYEEVLPGERRPRIADVVIMWRDASGDGILVIEAKKPGCGRNGVGKKDDPSNTYYLKYRAMRLITRQHQALLMDERDLRWLPLEMKDSRSVISWQELIAIQKMPWQFCRSKTLLANFWICA
jgi:hypothetical protein